MKKAIPSTSLRIVHQSRTPDSRGYDFACENARMSLVISPIVDGAEGWRVDAKGRGDVNDTPTTANEVGATPTEALRAVARTWREGGFDQGMARFDWDAIESLLTEVRAL